MTADRSPRVELVELPLGSARTVNVVLIDADPLTLVDTGLRAPESLATLEAAFARRGHRLEDLEQIVITHPHNDHFGAAAELARRSGARVIGDGAEAMARFPASFRGNGRMRLELFEEAGAPGELTARWRERVEHYADTAEAVVAERELGEGDVVRAGGVDWQVISTPGHAATSISLYQPESRLLIAGDILIGNAGASVTLHQMARPGRWLLDIADSLKKLSELDVATAYPGHGPLIEDAQRAIVDRRTRALQRLDEVGGMVEQAPRTAFGVSQAIYPPEIGRTALGLSQAIGYLEALEAQGRARSELKDGMRVYRR